MYRARHPRHRSRLRPAALLPRAARRQVPCRQASCHQAPCHQAWTSAIPTEQRREWRVFWTAALIALLIAVMAAGNALARVKLTTLPVRDRVVMNLDHERAVLVTEERVVPLLRGENDIDFAWRNTQIDADSVVFEIVDGGSAVRLLSVAYPHGENALLWKVWADQAGSVKTRISYLISGVEAEHAYRAVVDGDEKRMQLTRSIRIHNRANEQFATLGFELGEGQRLDNGLGLNETRELRVEQLDGVPISKRYEARLATHGYLDSGKKQLRVPMFYEWRNDAKHSLGAHALPAGKVRVFQQSKSLQGGHGFADETFLGEDRLTAVEKTEKAKLTIGTARDVSVIRRIEKREKQRIAGNLHDMQVVLKYELTNFKDEPVQLNVIEDIRHLATELGLSYRPEHEWVLERMDFPAPPDPLESNADTFSLPLELAPTQASNGEKKPRVMRLRVTFKNLW